MLVERNPICACDTGLDLIRAGALDRYDIFQSTKKEWLVLLTVTCPIVFWV